MYMVIWQSQRKCRKTVKRSNIIFWNCSEGGGGVIEAKNDIVKKVCVYMRRTLGIIRQIEIEYRVDDDKYNVALSLEEKWNMIRQQQQTINSYTHKMHNVGTLIWIISSYTQYAYYTL